MMRNNFEELEQRYEARYTERDEHAARKIRGSLSFFQLIGDIVELYLPKVFGLFVRMSGGSSSPGNGNPNAAEHASDEDRPRYPNTL